MDLSIVCFACGAEVTPPDVLATLCPHCKRPTLNARYNYAHVATMWRDGIPSNRLMKGMGRYAELLPTHVDAISLQEGWTPLIPCMVLGREHGFHRVYMKDERSLPTTSFKDRQACSTVAALKSRGVKEVVLASAGNALIAFSAYTARAGIACWVCINQDVPDPKVREALLFGARVLRFKGTYDEVKKCAALLASRRGAYLDTGAKGITGREGLKTIAFEVCEQLGILEGATHNKWIAPDWYIQAVSGGIGPLGVIKGFRELKQMGLIATLPKLAVVQVSGCPAMSHPFQQGKERADKILAHTSIANLSTGDPGMAYEILREYCLETGGTMIDVSEEDAAKMQRHIAQTEGISMEPAASVAFAGFVKLMKTSIVKSDERIVINCSGHSEPVAPRYLAGWAPIDVEDLNGFLSDPQRIDSLLATI